MNTYNTDINDYSKKYMEEHTRSFSYESVLVEVRRKQVLKSLNKYPHRHILEIGVGLEPLFQYCNDYESYTIVEPGYELVQNARKMAEGNNNIKIIHGFLEEVNEKLFESEDFDFIILSSLLHEVPDPDKLLQSIHRVCKPDTVIHINVPNVYSFHRLLAFEMGYIESIFDQSETEVKFQRHTRFDKESLFQIIEKNGFQILLQGTYFIKLFNNEKMEEMINLNIFNQDLIKGLEGMIKYMPDLGCEMFIEIKVIPQT